MRYNNRFKKIAEFIGDTIIVGLTYLMNDISKFNADHLWTSHVCGETVYLK